MRERIQRCLGYKNTPARQHVALTALYVPHSLDEPKIDCKNGTVRAEAILNSGKGKGWADMTRCTYCWVPVSFFQPVNLVDAENCMGNSFVVPKPLVRSIFELGYTGLLCGLGVGAWASNDVFYFQGLILMATFFPTIVAAVMIGPYDSRGYLHLLSYGAVASCYACAVMLREPSLPGLERFYAYYSLSADIACIFPLLFMLFTEKSMPEICCQCALEKHGWCGYRRCLHCKDRAERLERRRGVEERAVAFLMSSHARLGASSEAGMLQGGGGPLEMILGFASEAGRL